MEKGFHSNLQITYILRKWLRYNYVIIDWGKWFFIRMDVCNGFSNGMQMFSVYDIGIGTSAYFEIDEFFICIDCYFPLICGLAYILVCIFNATKD